MAPETPNFEADDRIKCVSCGHLEMEFEPGSNTCYDCHETEWMDREAAMPDVEPTGKNAFPYDSPEDDWAEDGPYGRIE